MIANQSAVCAHKRKLFSFYSIHEVVGQYLHTAARVLRTLKSMIGQAVFAQGTVCRECQAEADSSTTYCVAEEELVKMVWFDHGCLHKGTVSIQWCFFSV